MICNMQIDREAEFNKDEEFMDGDSKKSWLIGMIPCLFVFYYQFFYCFLLVVLCVADINAFGKWDSQINCFMLKS